MRAMVLETIGAKLILKELPTPEPGPGEIRLAVEACGVCRTDLHVVEGELPAVPLPVIPGHEIVGRVEAAGAGVTGLAPGQRVGVPWLARTCGHCFYCTHERENLCDAPLFTGYTRQGGYASHVVADAAYVFSLPDALGPSETLAPLLCAGLIGYRTLMKAGPGESLGLYGFGAAGHIVLQVARHEGRRVFAFTRPGDAEAQNFARRLGADWAGGSDETPPAPLDAVIIFAPVGALVPAALRVLRKGGRLVCGGIHMSDIPSFPYDILWQEREIVSTANLTRADGHAFLALAPRLGLEIETTPYPLADANRALADLREGRLQGAAVLIP
jgi:alcohol dehydrogenase, propanol-preferring